MYRYVVSSDGEDVVTAKWPPIITAAFVPGLGHDGHNHLRETLNLCDEFRRGLNTDEFIAWMVEHCPSAVWVERTYPDDDAEGSFTFEVMISDPDQAFHFRTRWT